MVGLLKDRCATFFSPALFVCSSAVNVHLICIDWLVGTGQTSRIQTLTHWRKYESAKATTLSIGLPQSCHVTFVASDVNVRSEYMSSINVQTALAHVLLHPYCALMLAMARMVPSFFFSYHCCGAAL